MTIFARFQAMNENDKASLVRKLMQSSTPDFDFFYLVALAVTMATLGLLENNASIVIGSMLIAPILYPVLGVSLGLIMSSNEIFSRSVLTLGKSLMMALGISIVAAWLFGGESSYVTSEIMMRTTPDLLHLFVAIIAGAAVSFTLGQPQWSDTIPGIAISVALIPPLAVVGIGIASMNAEVITGSLLLFLVNLGGIMLAALVSFSMMNLYAMKKVAFSTIKREEERIEEEQAAIKAVEDTNEAEKENENTNAHQ